MKGRVFAFVATLTALSVGFAPMAAADTLVQFETTSSGGRTLSATTAPVFPTTNNLVLAQGDIATVTAASATVTELFAQGGTWSVKAQMCGPNDYTQALPTAGDCDNHPDRMVRAAGASLPDADILQGALIAVSHEDPVVVLGGGTTSSGSEANLGGQITLLNNTGQTTTSVYNGTYTSTTNLAITDFDRIGVWKGMWIVTATL